MTYGYSKDKRPDLKQIKIGLSTQEQGLPLMGHVIAGNKPDTEWNIEAVEWMHTFFHEQGYRETVFVSDCALVTKDSLNRLAADSLFFISRLPETFSLAQQLKEQAWEAGGWNEIGTLSQTNAAEASRYRTIRVSAELEERSYTFVVVHSSALEATKEKTIAKRLQTQHKAFQTEANKLAKQRFSCESDARQARDAFVQRVTKQGWCVESAIETHETKQYGKAGRPSRQDQPTTSLSFSVMCTVGDMDTQRQEHLRRLESTFVLIARTPEHYDEAMIVREYKQQNSVETKFRILKNASYLGPMYLEKPERIQGIGYVFFLVLLIASYLEYRIREQMKTDGQFLTLPGKKQTQVPSIHTILEVLETISLMVWNGERLLPEPNHPQAYDMVRWAGFDMSIYMKSVT